jgi:hypothetical protein
MRSGQPHTTAALSIGKEPPVHIGQKVGWAPGPVWTLWRGEKSYIIQGSKSNPSAVQSIASRYTDCVMAVLLVTLYCWEYLSWRRTRCVRSWPTEISRRNTAYSHWISQSSPTYTESLLGFKSGIEEEGDFCENKQEMCMLKSSTAVSSVSAQLRTKFSETFYVRFEVFTVVTMNKAVFCVVAPCSSCVNRRSAATSSR